MLFIIIMQILEFIQPRQNFKSIQFHLSLIKSYFIFHKKFAFLVLQLLMLNQQDQDHNNLPQKENLNSGNLNDYILQGKIGTGNFGKVYRVKSKGNSNIYVDQ